MASNSDAEPAEEPRERQADPPQSSVGDRSNNSPLPEDQRNLTTFSVTDGPIRYNVTPTKKGGILRWSVVAYMKGMRGPYFESPWGITDDLAEEHAISPDLQRRLNDALEYAKLNLELPDSVRNLEHDKRGLRDLEDLME